MKAEILIDKETHDKFIEIENKLKLLGGEYTIERYHSKTEFGFEIHSNSDALQKMQERLIEVLEDEKKWWKFYRAYEERIGRLSEEGLHFSRIWEEHRLGWIHDIDKGAIEK